ncbi:DNA-dependent RNA polymerase [Pyruvatibacter mobilis]|uniref:DNA-directed RNA polymerase n=1 Tax=Pyruvatibacter mobilis TaxID=1712261 RepID=A0A845Q7B4_9HYPH|nr:DNA-directed RNA polymerase [Pyruvatibacter mobilis]NBG94475.1 DNA-dependent RNA polymerase [Pyruvatibacter mobilis]QJD73996.1 DNA-dependent RNA polymerase [Pyruvatibacter mobilis]
MAEYIHPMKDTQLELEEAMAVATRDAFYKEIEAARAEGREAETGYGRHILKHSVLPVAEAITEWLEKAQSGRPGRKHLAVKYLTQIEADVAAYLALKEILDKFTGAGAVFTKTALAIATSIEDELRFRKFREEARADFDASQKRLSAARAQNRERKKTLLRLMANRNNVSWDNWPKRDKLHLGTLLIEMVRNVTGFIEVKRMTVGIKETQYVIQPTPQAIEWIDRANANLELMAPKYWPMVCPPKRWSNPWNGGYWSGFLRRIPLVKSHNRHYLEELAEIDMPEVYDAINAMQETPWKVNGRVLSVLKEALETNLEIGSLPPVEDLDLPPVPEDIDTNDDAKKEWKKRASRVYGENLRIRSKRMQVRRTARLAEQFAEYPEVFFPYQLDFRGRAYAVPLFLNPQGPDYAKALLTFAHGKPIGDGPGAGWLAIHGANVYGEDKVSLEERITWIEDRSAQIMAVDEDPWAPESIAFWGEADKPWQFLAFCFEWAGYLREGASFVSSLPVNLDGSCNGLQHYSAALRDPEGGAAVNLIPSEVPQDIYGLVAEKAKAELRLLCSHNGAEGEPGSPEWMARKLLDFGINRKVTKKAVMCLPYGLTQYSARDYIEEGLRSIAEPGQSPFAHSKVVHDREIEAEGWWEAASFLTPIVWGAIEDTVRGASDAMEWLQKTARYGAKEGLPISWTTPDGFYVEQRYAQMKENRVKTIIDGETVKLSLQEELPDIDRRKMSSAIAPNWVHSMDATALRQFVVLARDNGLRHFALVHDSYGTVATDVQLMSVCLRRAFVDMYEEHDVLAEFQQEIAAMLSQEDRRELPPVPAKGDLDIALVEESDFFFA